MAQIYQSRRRGQGAPAEQKFETSVPGPSLQELAAGAQPSAAQMGHPVDLPGAIREKMEASFGADFSGVKLYESQTVADAGAQAMTMGSNVAFAPGQLDLSSASGQALLGHELSHVVSQAKGESAGRGFLADSGLEAQADRQGMRAARGESVYSGPVTPLSASAVPASAAGPMQAEKDITKAKRQAASEGKSIPSIFHPFQRAEAKERFLSRWNANQLKNEFNSIKLGSTEESRRAGRQRQVDMLMEMQEAINDQSLGGGGDYDNVKTTLGNTLLHLGFVPYGKEHNSPEVNNVIEVMNAIQDARLAAAQEAKNKYESGEYGEQGSLEANARMANSPENRRFKNGALLLSQMGMGVTSDTDAFPVLQQLLEPGTPGAPAPTEAQSFLTAHTNERELISGLGEEQYGQFVDEGKKAASAKVAAWYRRKFGRVVRKQPRHH